MDAFEAIKGRFFHGLQVHIDIVVIRMEKKIEGIGMFCFIKLI